MPISFTCPHCGHATQVADHFAGQTGPCVSCGAQVTIPMVGGGYQGGAPPAKPSSSSSTGAVVGVIIVAALGIMVVCGGVLAALLLPAVQAAREAARRTSCSNNLKQIGIAMHNYHDAFNTFPPAFIPDESGEPERSWRALVLPFIEQQPLYEEYDMNESWDAPENQFAIVTDLPTYRCPSDSSSVPTETSYVLLTGDGTIFEDADTPSIRNILDGTSNTIMAVERSRSGINWSEPRDMDIEDFVLMFNPTQFSDAPTSHPGGLNVLMADGSVRFLSFNIGTETARALATRNGGESIDQW